MTDLFFDLLFFVLFTKPVNIVRKTILQIYYHFINHSVSEDGERDG